MYYLSFIKYDIGIIDDTRLVIRKGVFECVYRLVHFKKYVPGRKTGSSFGSI